MEMAEKLSRVGREPQELPLPRELDRTRTALAGAVSSIIDRTGAIHAPAVRHERRSRSISR